MPSLFSHFIFQFVACDNEQDSEPLASVKLPTAGDVSDINLGFFSVFFSPYFVVVVGRVHKTIFQLVAALSPVNT